jgi:hypothetical protein
MTEQTKKLNRLPYDFIWYHGGKMSRLLTDAYNASLEVSERMEASNCNQEVVLGEERSRYLMISLVNPYNQVRE